MPTIAVSSPSELRCGCDGLEFSCLWYTFLKLPLQEIRLHSRVVASIVRLYLSQRARRARTSSAGILSTDVERLVYDLFHFNPQRQRAANNSKARNKIFVMCSMSNPTSRFLQWDLRKFSANPVRNSDKRSSVSPSGNDDKRHPQAIFQ